MTPWLSTLTARLAQRRPDQVSTAWRRDQLRQEGTHGTGEEPAWDWNAIKRHARHRDDDHDHDHHEAQED